MPMTLSWRRSVLLSVLPLWACAQVESTTAAPEPSLRVVVTTVGEYASTAEVQNRVANLARVPVREAVELAPNRYRMTLLCADQTACRAAIARIMADRTFALAVDADSRQQIPTKPTRDAAR